MSQPTCPICHKTPNDRFRPFCSKRCADIDLGRWFTEQYSAPAPPDAGDEDTEDSSDSTA